MREEIGAAVLFITRLIRQSGSVSSEKVVEFSNSLSAILNEKFQNHWYQDHPTKGQGYRCIRINSAEPIDPVLEKAAQNSGLQYHDLRLPSELTLWVDPKDVCCRLKKSEEEMLLNFMAKDTTSGLYFWPTKRDKGLEPFSSIKKILGTPSLVPEKFGESRGSFCTLVTTKDGNLETMAHSVNIEELLRQETERHNQQVNIVTTRSNMNNSYTKFSKSVHNSNYYSKFQNNFYNNQQFQNTHNRFRPQNKNNGNNNNNRKQPMYEEQVNGVRVSPDHVNEVRQQFMDQVNSIVKEGGEKEGQPKHKSSSTLPSKDTKSSTTKNSSVSHISKPAADAAKSTNENTSRPSNESGSKSDGAKLGGSGSENVKASFGTDNSKSSKVSQAKGRYQPDQNTSVKPGSYNGGKGTQWLNRTHSKFSSQKVY